MLTDVVVVSHSHRQLALGANDSPRSVEPLKTQRRDSLNEKGSLGLPPFSGHLPYNSENQGRADGKEKETSFYS